MRRCRSIKELAESEGYWTRYITHSITGFLDFIHHPGF
jgi:hypothetical protein